MLDGRTWGPLRNRAGISLPDAVKAAFGGGKGSLCPCCTRPMIWRWTPRPGKRMPSTLATHAHDVAVARAGDPRCWFFACSQCNNDQGALDLVTWARKLIYDDDPRAARVVEVSKLVRGWVAAYLEEMS